MPNRVVQDEVNRVQLKLSVFEHGLLRFLASRHHSKNMTAVIREAIRLLALRDPSFDPDGFMSFMKKEIIRDVKPPQLKRKVLAEIEALVATYNASSPEGVDARPLDVWDVANNLDDFDSEEIFGEK